MHRKTKTTSVDLSANPKVRKGRAAERIVAEFFELFGVPVTLTEGNGPDITLGGGARKTIEVKSVSKNRGYLCIGAVKERRRNDDYIAIVFEDETVAIFPMAGYLKTMADSSGSAGVTRLKRALDAWFAKEFPEEEAS